MQILKLIRVHQWVKNLFVFLPVFFSGEILNWETNLNALLGFFMFSFAAGAVYVINDYVDIEKDKLHPTKKDRPLASGAIYKSQAIIIFVGLLILAASIATYLYSYLPDGIRWQGGFIVLCYFLMNLAYSFKLKHIAILDVIIIAIGFLMRVLVGGYVTGIAVSKWAILLVFMLALILALGKRRGEMINAELEGKTRKALDGYSMEFLNAALSVVSATTIMCYILFSLAPETQEKFHNVVYLTVIFVIAGILRYLQLAFVFDKTESPTKLVYKDLFLQLVMIVWALAFAVLIYLKDFKF